MTEQTRNELKSLDGRLSKREDTLDRKLDTLSVKEKQLDDLEARLSQRDKVMANKEEQLGQVLGFVTDRAIDGDGGVQIGLGHADLGALGGGLTFRFAHIRPAAQQVGRDADDHVRRRARNGARAQFLP